MDPATQDAMAADHFDATDKPFRFDLMLALLAELGTGPDALLAAEHEEGEKYVDVIEDETSNIHLLTPPPQVALKRQAVAQNIVTHMFLPRKSRSPVVNLHSFPQPVSLFPRVSPH